MQSSHMHEFLCGRMDEASLWQKMCMWSRLTVSIAGQQEDGNRTQHGL